MQSGTTREESWLRDICLKVPCGLGSSYTADRRTICRAERSPVAGRHGALHLFSQNLAPRQRQRVLVIGTATPDIADAAAEALFSGPGEMRARCRTFEWGATPLGPVSTWPASFC